jgi:metal-sulfur cluster biosynthetic enzyme
MTDQMTRTDATTPTETEAPAADVATAPAADGATAPPAVGAPAPAVDPQARATELAILDSLRSVVDPEIGMNVVELALIRQIILGDGQTEVKMILTTPFCPYAGSMIQQVKEATEEVVGHDVKVTLLAERWDPRDAGLMW